MLRTSSGSLFQSFNGQMAELVDQHRGAALGQEQRRRSSSSQDSGLRSISAPARTRRACPGTRRAPRRPGDTSHWSPKYRMPASRPRAPGRRDSRTATAGRRRNSRLTWKLRASQSIPRAGCGCCPPLPQFTIFSPWRNSCPWKRRIPLMIRLETPAQVMLARRRGGIGGVGPAPVNLLAAFPVGARQGPDLGLDGHAGLAGGVQAQQGVLRVGVVAVLAALEVGVGPRAGPVDGVAGLDLGALQPVDVGGDPQPVALGVGGGEDHGLEPDGVGAAQVLGPEPAEQLQRPADCRRIGLLAGGHQGERHQAGGAGPGIALDVRPGAVGALLRLEETDPVADGPLDFLAGDAGPRGWSGIEREAGHQGRDAGAARDPRDVTHGRAPWDRIASPDSATRRACTSQHDTPGRTATREERACDPAPLLLEIGHDLGQV